jgi:dolichol-phosphate hexosyltransferase
LSGVQRRNGLHQGVIHNSLDLAAPIAPEEQLIAAWQSENDQESPQSPHLPVKLSVLMAAYNEAPTITLAVQGVLAATCPCDLELIVVDDGSTDGTWEQLLEINDDRLRLYRHDGNSGKGSAILSALNLATGTHILPFDADLEYDPDDIARLIKPVLKGRCDVVYGVRLFGLNTVYQSYRYAAGNRVLTRLANVLFDANLSDLHTCLKLIPRAMVSGLQLKSPGFGMDTEITAILLRQGVRPFEVPVSYYSRPRAKGKKITWRDGVACIRILLRVRLQPGIRRDMVSDVATVYTPLWDDTGPAEPDAPQVISASA